MISSPKQAGLTARALLLGAENDTARLAHALSEHDVLGQTGADLARLTREGRDAASEAIASVTAGMLELDLGDMLISGWRRYQLLMDAARETAQSPGRQEVVQLASHQVTCTFQPKVDLMISDVLVHTFQFQLTVVFDIEVAAAIIRGGKLVGLRSGEMSVCGTLSLQAPGKDIELMRQERRIDLHLIIHLGDGLPLLSADSDPPSSLPGPLSQAAG